MNIYQTFLSNCSDSCTVWLPTHCHIVIVHIHGGDPGCHVGMISPHLFGFRNISSVLVKALAKHSLYRSKADSRKTVTHTFEMQGTKCSLEHNAKDMFICLHNGNSQPLLKALSAHDPLSQVGYVFSFEQFIKTVFWDCFIQIFLEGWRCKTIQYLMRKL